MKTELNPPKKAPGNSILKSLPAEQQEDIATHAREHTLVETKEYLATKHQLTASPPTISRFLAWFDGKAQEQLNAETLEGVAEQLEARHPDWTPEKIRAMGQAYFSAYAIRQNNVRAWWQIQQLALKREQLELEQEKDVRNTCEWTINTLKDPKIQAKVYDDSQSYAEKLKQVRIIMFGDKESTDVNPLNGGIVESGVGPKPPKPLVIEDDTRDYLRVRGELLRAAEAIGITPPRIYAKDTALLTAYLTGKPEQWSNYDPPEQGVVEPPTIDPRKDPTSPWFAIYQELDRLQLIQKAPTGGPKAEGGSEEGRTSKVVAANLQPSTCSLQPAAEQEGNIQHPVGEKANIQHSTLASQARHEMDAPSEERASRSVVNIQHSTGAAPTSSIKHPASSNYPLSTSNQPPLLEAAGSLSYEAATKVVNDLMAKAMTAGYARPKPRDVAALRAYLTGHPMKWRDKYHGYKIMHPPALDPRLDPASWWGRVGKHVQATMSQCENN